MFSIGATAKLMISLMVVIAVCAYSVFVLKGQIETKAKKIYEKRSMLAVFEKRYENFFQLSKDYKMVGENLELIRKSLPKEDGLDVAVNAFDSLATQKGVSQTLNFEPMSGTLSSASVKPIKFSAVVTGDAWALSDYLEKLGSLPYFIVINNVDVTSEGVEGKSRLTLVAQLYIRN